MPLQQCGRRGWRYGKNGHCYDGPSESLNKKKAIDQGLAITGGGKKFHDEMAKSELTEEDKNHIKAAIDKKPINYFIELISQAFNQLKG